MGVLQAVAYDVDHDIHDRFPIGTLAFVWYKPDKAQFMLWPQASAMGEGGAGSRGGMGGGARTRVGVGTQTSTPTKNTAQKHRRQTKLT